MARQKEFDMDEAVNRAVEIFWQRGYERTSLNDLLEHLQIGRASFYNAFGDKHALFMLALQRYLERSDEATLIRFLNHAESHRTAIEAVFETIVETLATDTQQKGCLIVNAMIEVAPDDREVAQFVEDYSQRCESALYDALRRAQLAQEISQALDIRAMARFLLATIRGMRVTARLSHERRVFEDIAAMALSRLDEK